MVERTIHLDSVFSSLSDATRRDILNRVSRKPQSVGELASVHKNLSFAAVAKHIVVLQEAELVIKKREGKYQIISVNPETINRATRVLQEYKAVWETRFDVLDKILSEDK